MKKLLLLLTLFGTQFTVLQISQITAQAEDFSNEEDKKEVLKEMLKELEMAIMNKNFNAVEQLLNNELQFKDLLNASNSLKRHLLKYLIKHRSSKQPQQSEHLKLFEDILKKLSYDANMMSFKLFVKELRRKAKKYNQDEMLSIIEDLT